MNTAGEAASLFGGPPDSANDPFASSLGTDTAATSAAGSHPNSSDPFDPQGDSNASGLFGSTSGEGEFFSGAGASNAQDYGAYGNHTTADYGYSSYNAYSEQGQSSHTDNYYAPPAHGNQQNQYSQYGGVDTYGQQQGVSGNGSGHGTYANANANYSYDAYSSYAPSSQPVYGTTQDTSAYAPYAPAVSGGHAAAPAQDAGSSLGYDLYKPAATATSQSSTYTSPAVPDYSQQHTAVHHSIPPPVSTASSGFAAADVPPPVPSASAYRPKTSNAYDPPLPPPKPKRTQQQQHWQQPPPVTYGQPAYAANPASRIVSPPPPPPRGTTPSRFSAQARPPSAASSHYAPPPPPPNQSLYDSGMASYTPPAPHGSIHSPPPPAPPSDSSNLYTHAEPAPPPLQHNGAYNTHYADGFIDDDGLGLYNQPSSPQKQQLNHHEFHEEVCANTTSGAGLHGLSQSGLSFEDEEGGLPEVETSKPLSPANSISPPPLNGVNRSNPTSPAPIDLTISPTQPPRKVVSRQQSPERTKSPGGSSIRSVGSASVARRSIDQPPRRSSVNALSPPSSYDPPTSTFTSPPSNPYIPAAASGDHIRRTTSPATFAPSPLAQTVDPYVPSGSSTAGVSAARDRSMSSSSTFSSGSAAKDPYAPSGHSRQQSKDSYKYPSPPQPFHAPTDGAFATSNATYDRSGAQTLSVAARLVHAPYAPSPSLLGSNDPLGRTSARVPVVSFGFGGKLVTCFHGASNVVGVGFDVALSSRQSTDVHIRTLHKVIPQSALDNSSASYPGPLFSDPGTPTASLVRTGAAAQAKTKKTRVVNYLEERAEEISRGLGYLHLDSIEGKRAEARHMLLLLLKVMVENDGKLSGTAQIDTAIRQVLVPHLANQDTPADGLSSPPLIGNGFPAIASNYGASGASGHDSPISVHTLRVSHLVKIQELLVRGDRRLAFQYAADEKLWAHAMVIASSIDRDAWKEVVKEFVQTELSSTAGADLKPLKGQEPLRVAYSLFAGHGAASVQQLSPQKLLIDNMSGLQVPAVPNATISPLSPNFPGAAPSAVISADVLSKWAETAAMIISNPMTPEASSALTALGDQLQANGWYEAAHICYLLSPQTSPLSGVANPAARIVLVGGANPIATPNFWKDPDPIVLTEIAEFALSLAAPVKGQEAFNGLPHLQAYRLIRATYLAEIGNVQIAQRYCEAISNSLGRNSPYVHPHLLVELKSLSDRLIAAPHVDKTGSWIGGKMTRPSLDKLGGWFEERISQFIAGGEDSQSQEIIREQDRSFSGPFAHFSQISSATSSAIPTPQRSMTDLTEIPHAPTPPHRAGSAMALRPPASSHAPINRASSAMDYIRKKASPVPRVSSASAATQSFADAAYQPTANGYSHFHDSTPKVYQGPAGDQLTESTAENEEDPASATLSAGGPQIASWWNDTSESGAPTPTVGTFVPNQGANLDSGEGFVSLMDNDAFSVTPTPSSMRQSNSTHSYENGDFDDDDDLGLGNSSGRPQTMERAYSSSSVSTPTETAAPEPAKEAEKPDAKQAASSGWLSRLWRRSDTPGPVKANLGEQTSFYYDKDLKRWVNKNSKGDDEKPAAAPPPPRAQTASPGTAAARLPTGPPIARTPPARPATAIDLTDSPPKMRPRSNLVPSDAPPVPSSPVKPKNSMMDGPPGLDGPPPPGARAKVQAKRNVRNRYVDVFQQ